MQRIGEYKFCIFYSRAFISIFNYATDVLSIPTPGKTLSKRSLGKKKWYLFRSIDAARARDSFRFDSGARTDGMLPVDMPASASTIVRVASNASILTGRADRLRCARFAGRTVGGFLVRRTDERTNERTDGRMDRCTGELVAHWFMPPDSNSWF